MTALLTLTFTLSALEVDYRDETEAHDISQGSKPSEIPTGGLFRDLHEIGVDAFKHADVSGHPDKKVYVGYGIYDPDQEQCAKVDVGSGADPLYNNEFLESSLQIFNGHAYLRSKNKMTRSQCVSRANHYFGYPAIPTTKAEDTFLSLSYAADNPIWLGLYKTAANVPYINAKGDQQMHFNFFVNTDPYSTSVKAVKMLGKYWHRTNESERNYCVIEFETDDYKRPIKVCAPWWTVERTYPLPAESRYMVNSVDKDGKSIQIDVRKFNKALFPKQAKVCVKRDETSTDAHIGDTSKVVCNSYYSIERSPACQENLLQDVCFVNECRGAIQNSCELKATEDAPLTYSKKLVIDNEGVERWVKGRDKIKMHSYECDVFTATAQCSQWSDITMMPQECPDSTTSDGNPIYVYGDPSKPVGNPVTALKGKCPNGQTVNVPINILATTSRRCLRYQWLESKNNWAESCTQDRPYLDHTVHVNINETDSYQEDPLCVRLNNINDARPPQMAQVKFKRSGYAALNLKKAYIEGGESDFSPVPLTTGYIDDVLNHMDWSQESNTTGSPPPIDQSKLNIINCDDYDGIKDIYSDFMVGFLNDNLKKNKFGKVLRLDGDARIVNVNNLTWFQCNSLAASIGSDSPYSITANPVISYLPEDYRDFSKMTPEEITNYQNSFDDQLRFNELGVNVTNMITPESEPLERGQCPIHILKIQSDKFGDITGSDPFVTDTVEEMPYEGCRRLALCTHSDYLNPRNYSGNQVCKLKIGIGAGDATENEYQNEIDAEIESQVQKSKKYPKSPYEVRKDDEDSYTQTSQWIFGIDGTKDIFFVQEYVPPLRGWGYLPSYNFLEYTSSSVSVNNTQVWPIIQHYKMKDKLRMNWMNRSNAHRFYGTSSSFVNANAFVGDTGGFSARPESYAYNLMTGGVGWLVSGLITVFSGPHKEFEADVSASVMGLKSDLRHYKENYYPQYEGRVQDPSENNKLKYSYMRYKTGGRYDRSDESRFYKSAMEIMDDFFETLNVYEPHPPYSSYYPAQLKKLVKGYPSIDWWEIYDHKQTGWKEAQGELEIKRNVTTHYMGAVNGVSIVVPYNGDYDVYAYDSLGSLVAQTEVKENDFIKRGSTGYTFSAALPNLGEKMNIVVPEANSCKDANMVSVGGGVAGGYYEVYDYNNYYRPYANCAEADHKYVEEHAITQIKIKLSNTDKYYVIDLDYPLPYINRIFLVSMENTESREYRCYGNFPECSDYEHE